MNGGGGGDFVSDSLSSPPSLQSFPSLGRVDRCIVGYFRTHLGHGNVEPVYVEDLARIIVNLCLIDAKVFSSTESCKLMEVGCPKGLLEAGGTRVDCL